MFLSLGKNECRKLSEPVREYLRQNFRLQSQELDQLRCFEFNGIFAGEKAKRIRIFSPGQAKENHLTIRTNSDLELHPEIVLFDGSIYAGGRFYFNDRRKAKA